MLLCTIEMVQLALVVCMVHRSPGGGDGSDGDGDGDCRMGIGMGMGMGRMGMGRMGWRYLVVYQLQCT